MEKGIQLVFQTMEVLLKQELSLVLETVPVLILVYKISWAMIIHKTMSNWLFSMQPSFKILSKEENMMLMKANGLVNHLNQSGNSTLFEYPISNQ